MKEAMNNKKQTGFTIVELLIVIVVIGILAAITIVAFNGIQNRSINTGRIQELASWQKLFQLYKAENGTFPPVAVKQYCLGSGFPIGPNSGGVARCRDFNGTGTSSMPESDNAALMAELSKYGSLPSGNREQINGTVGPYMSQNSWGVVLYAVINGTPDDCMSPTVSNWSDNNGRTICAITMNN